MKIKKIFFPIALITAAMTVILSLTGCAAPPYETKAPPAKPSVTETNKPAVTQGALDKKIKIALLCSGENAEPSLYFSGVKSEAALMDIETADYSASGISASADDGIDAIIVYSTDKDYASFAAAAKSGIPVCVFGMRKGTAPDNISLIYYNNEKETDMVLNAVLTYPPHDMPVRLISLFESKTSNAYKAYNKLAGEGKIFAKETYFASDKKKLSAKDWINAKLKKYQAGMADALFAENWSLAKEALDALESAKRADMEIFSPGISDGILERMRANPEVLAQAVGANSFLAGALSLQIASFMLNGMPPVSEELLPCIIDAGGLIGKDGASALMAVDPQGLADKYKAYNK